MNNDVDDEDDELTVCRNAELIPCCRRQIQNHVIPTWLHTIRDHCPFRQMPGGYQNPSLYVNHLIKKWN